MNAIWITGVGLASSLGEGAGVHLDALGALREGGFAPVLDVTTFAPFPIHPMPALELDRQISKRGDQRQMEPWQRLGTYAAGLALDAAGARGLVADMHLIVAAGGGERDTALDESIAAELAGLPAHERATLLNERLLSGLRPTLFLAQLSNLLAGNISIVHGVTGSSRTLMGEEVAGADAVRIAAARLAEGRGEAALVGGAYAAGRWDMLLLLAAGGVLARGPWAPLRQRAGMVTGSVGAFLVLETERAARARGASGLARLGPVRTTAARRAAPGDAGRSLAALRDGLPPAALALTAASGAPATAEELAQLPADAVAVADLFGHALEAAFPAALGLAALAIDARFAPDAQVTAMGQWRGEAAATLHGVAA